MKRKTVLDILTITTLCLSPNLPKASPNNPRDSASETQLEPSLATAPAFYFKSSLLSRGMFPAVLWSY